MSCMCLTRLHCANMQIKLHSSRFRRRTEGHKCTNIYLFSFPEECLHYTNNVYGLPALMSRLLITKFTTLRTFFSILRSNALLDINQTYGTHSFIAYTHFSPNNFFQLHSWMDSMEAKYVIWGKKHSKFMKS